MSSRFSSLLLLIPMLISYSGFSQPVKPPKGHKFIPPIFGQWRTGDLLGINNGHTFSVKLDNPIESGMTALPIGTSVEFKPGYDEVAHEYISLMNIMPPFPLESCYNQILQYHCEIINDKPTPRQVPICWEFNLETTKEDVLDTFELLGATQRDVCYRIHVNGHEWFGNFFVSKDRQTAWTAIYPGEAHIIESNGSKRSVAKTDQLFQVYHRVPAHSPSR